MSLQNQARIQFKVLVQVLFKNLDTKLFDGVIQIAKEEAFEYAVRVVREGRNFPRSIIRCF